MSSASYSDLKDSDKQRLAAAYVNIKDQKSAMTRVDWEKATLDFNPAGSISGISFKTSISRMKRDYSRLSPSDKSRMAACVINIKEADLKPIMTSIDWAKAATDFQPSGKITAASFRTSIQRILNPKEKPTGGSATKITGKKRKAPTAAARSSSSSPSESTPSRKKKTKATQTLEEDDNAIPTTEEHQVATGQDQDLPQSAMGSRESSKYMTPPIKPEHIDDDNAYGGEEESLDNPRFFI